ncbi:hypothetical protein JTE90_002022 [Oedothorax gibbosus]|uniref:Uncharacterized protein n=1 Tax=Oedothorax gibbosus TaxID=931172 RepID=A0AAV6UNI5_9ARAC|nr:hypothetical protein JTE90_002022 [Oedothorax gibbosus]
MAALRNVVCFCVYACLCTVSTVGAFALFHVHDEREELRENIRRVMTPLMALGVVLKLVFGDEFQAHHLHPHHPHPRALPLPHHPSQHLLGY